MKNFENEFTTVVGKEGFTLSETLITVAILGVVAAITIPAIINHQTESANRTKLKKAMTTYEKALNQMIIENDLKTNQAIKDFGEDGGSCANTTEYFKKVEGSGCRFKTADRIWWDISDIENPLVMLKDKYSEETIANLKALAKKEDDREVFGMVGRLDDTTGVLRIKDKGAETAGDNKTYLDKLYGFINSSSSSDEATCSGATCVAQKVSKIAEACTSSPYKNCYNIEEYGVSYYDENGNKIMYKGDCTRGTGENCQSANLYENFSLKNGGTKSLIYHCNPEGNECSSLNLISYSDGTNLIGGYKINWLVFNDCEGDDVDSCTGGFCGIIVDSDGNNVLWGHGEYGCEIKDVDGYTTCPNIAEWFYAE